MCTGELFDALLANRDESYRQMQLRLLPGIDAKTILGVRTPVLRSLAKQLEDKEFFLRSLPHKWFEENQIHAFLLEKERDFPAVIEEVETFLPFVDNWETCDQLRPKCFCRHRPELLAYIRRWIASGEPYTVRFGIGMLMVHYLDAEFHPEYLEWVASVSGEAYYVRMMVAWYFATALAKQYDSALPYITGCRLDKWVHNKTIQKAVESDRIPAEHKQTLKQYRL
ncbi:MAG: DNA alkylation repair protein [Faecousia sp.]